MAMVMMTLVITLVGCGQPETLEAYINSDEELSQSIKDMESSDETGTVTTSVEGNQLIITSKYKETFSGEEKEYIVKALKEGSDSVEKEMLQLVDVLEDGSNIEGISIKVNYLDGAGEELHSETYE